MNNKIFLILGVLVLGIQLPSSSMDAQQMPQPMAPLVYLFRFSNNNSRVMHGFIQEPAQSTPFLLKHAGFFASRYNYSVSLIKVVEEYFNLLELNKDLPSAKIKLCIYLTFIDIFTDKIQSMADIIKSRALSHNTGPNAGIFASDTFIAQLKSYIKKLIPIFLTEDGFSHKEEALGEFFNSLEASNNIFGMFLHSKEMQEVFREEYELINKYINARQKIRVENLVNNCITKKYLAAISPQEYDMLCQSQPQTQLPTPYNYQPSGNLNQTSNGAAAPKLKLTINKPQQTMPSNGIHHPANPLHPTQAIPQQINFPNWVGPHQTMPLPPTSFYQGHQAAMHLPGYPTTNGINNKKRSLGQVGQEETESPAKRQKVQENNPVRAYQTQMAAKTLPFKFAIELFSLVKRIKQQDISGSEILKSLKDRPICMHLETLIKVIQALEKLAAIEMNHPRIAIICSYFVTQLHELESDRLTIFIELITSELTNAEINLDNMVNIIEIISDADNF